MVGPKIIAALDVYSIGILYTRTRAYVNGGVWFSPVHGLLSVQASVPFFTSLGKLGEDAKLDATTQTSSRPPRVVGVAL